MRLIITADYEQMSRYVSDYIICGLALLREREARYGQEKKKSEMSYECQESCHGINVCW